MKRIRLVIAMTIIVWAAVSCDDELFGPRSLEGTWNVTENSEAHGPQTFIVGIEYISGDETRIIIGNFGNLDMIVEVEASISGLILTIPGQTVQDSRRNNFTISGSGTATTNLRRINWNYRIDTDDYTAVFEKRN